MKIDKNIPMPKRIGVRGNGKYPWQEMEVGDSIHFENVTGGSNSKEAVAARSWACRYGNGKRFSCRAVDGGLRIWRIA